MILKIKKNIRLFLLLHEAACILQETNPSIQLNYCHKGLHILVNMVRHGHNIISKEQQYICTKGKEIIPHLGNHSPVG